MKPTTIFMMCFLFFASCGSSNKDASEGLSNARQHVIDKEYAEALKEYKWFFENSTKIESAMFGVKHSYCVCEWRKLGDLYEPALDLYRNELHNRKNRLIGGEANWDLFMEFFSLCDHDGKMNEVLEVFMVYHDDDQQREFSKMIFRRIKEELLSLGHIEICSKYITDPLREARNIIELHQLNVEYEKKDENKYNDEDFPDRIYDDEAGYLLTVLKKSNRIEEFETVKTKLQSYYFPKKLEELITELDETEKGSLNNPV